MASSVTKGDMNFNEGIGLGSGFWEGVSGGEGVSEFRGEVSGLPSGVNTSSSPSVSSSSLSLLRSFSTATVISD